MNEAVGFQTRATVTQCLAIGSIGVLILGIQPLLLGALLNAGVLDLVQLGWTATAEIVMMSLGVLLGSRWLRSAYAKPLLLVSAVAIAGANLASYYSSGVVGIIALRAIAGLCEGLLIAVSVLTISYGRSPGRLNAIFLTMGTFPQLLLAYGLPAFVAPLYGMTSGFLILAATGLLSGILVFSVRQSFAPAIEESSGKIVWTPIVVLALAASLLTAAAIGACWAYVEPLGAAFGFSPEQIGVAVTISLLFQVASTIVISLVGWRIPFVVALLGGAIGQIIAVSLLLYGHSLPAFYIGLAAFGFLWTGSMPFGTDLIVAVDKSRATAPLLLPLSFLGLSAGPFAASFFVSDGITGAFMLGIAGFAVSLILYAITFRTAGRTLPTIDAHVVQVTTI